MNRHPKWLGLYEDGSVDIFNGYTPLESQAAFLNVQEKWVCWGGAVREGKTWALCWKLFALAWSYPGNLLVLGRWIKEHLYNSTLATFKRLYPSDKYPITYYPNEETTEEIRFPNKSKILLVPLADRKRWPGAELGGFGIDQLEQCTRETWTDLERRVCLMTVPHESHWGGGVANFEANWDWARDVFVDKIGLTENVKHLYKYLEFEVGQNDKNLPPGYREERIGSMSPLEADRLMRGIDHRKIGKIYKKWDETRHVKMFELDDLGPCRYVVSYDYGREHPTAILLGAVDRNGRIWILAEHYEREMDVPDHEMAVQRLVSELNFPLSEAMFTAGWDIFSVKSNGKNIADEWSSAFKWDSAPHGPGAIQTRIERTSNCLADMTDGNPGVYVHPRCVNFRYEIARYKYRDDGSGMPAQQSDTYRTDACDAFGILCEKAMAAPAAAPVKSSILTPDSYKKMLKLSRPGRRFGYWMPGAGDPDPATVKRKNTSGGRGGFRGFQR